MALPSRDLPAARYQAGDIIAGKYRLDALLGQGGMGAVWGAFNLQLEAEVAIKLLARDDVRRELMEQRLKQEAKATARLGHPAIVRVFDVGESEGGDPFIVMELLKGRSLATVLSDDGCLPCVHAVKLLLPIADALSVAHAKGIIHRDLKPDNVFITVEDDQVQPKLVDFGIVKLADRASGETHLTQVGMVLGSPEYMSPEQARGLEDVDHRSDIWSFCVVLYELISGRTPFAASNYNALLRSIVEDEPKPLVTRSAEEEELWQILRRGLEKTRDQRFRSMSDLGRALASWLIRQNVVEDVCGASLEAKWILRASDPTALRGPRASLSSFPGLPPQSGVRATHDLATAVTVGAKPVDLTPSESATASPPRERARLRGAALILVAAGSAAILTLFVLLALRGQGESRAGTMPTGVGPSVATPEPPKAAMSTIQSEAVPPSVTLSPTPVASARPTAPALAASARRARSARPTASSSTSPSSDLLSPY